MAKLDEVAAAREGWRRRVRAGLVAGLVQQVEGEDSRPLVQLSPCLGLELTEG